MLNLHPSALPSCHQTPDELTRTTIPSRDESMLRWKHGMLTFFLTFIYSGKACWTRILFSSSVSRSPQVFRFTATAGRGLPASLISISQRWKKQGHFLFSPEPNFHRQYADSSWLPSSHKPHACKNNGVKLVLIKYIKGATCNIFLFLKIKTTFPIKPVASWAIWMCFEKKREKSQWQTFVTAATCSKRF